MWREPIRYVYFMVVESSMFRQFNTINRNVCDCLPLQELGYRMVPEDNMRDDSFTAK